MPALDLRFRPVLKWGWSGVDTPRVSVIMAVRDGAPWLSAACRSILDQALRDIELIVVDDGSRDETPELIAGLAHFDARVRPFRLSATGLAGALNKGVEAARAPLLARLDADDIALPGRIERQFGHLDRHPEIVLLGTWAQKIDAGGRPLGLLKPEPDPVRLETLLARRNPFIHSTVMMRTEMVRRVGAYREACRHAEDYDLWLRLAEVGGIAILPEALVQYRIHERSVSRQHVLNQCFSMRLARRAAAMRRASGVDPLSDLRAAPDWEDAGALEAFYAEDAALFRFLALGIQDVSRRLQGLDIRLPTPTMFAGLSHEEKKFARRAIRRLILAPGRPKAVSAGKLLLHAAHGALGWRFVRAPQR